MDSVIYFGKVNLYWSLFYILYCLLLRNYTFFRWNRAYLTSTLVVAFLLPVVTFSENVTLVPASAETLKFFPAHTSLPKITDGFPPWLQFVFAVQIAGSLFMLFRLLEGIRDLVSLIRKGEIIKMDDFTLVLLPNNEIGSFSFLKWLVVNRTDYEEHFEPILLHESVHIRQLHTIDILLIELLKIPFWFNPSLWFYKRSIQEVHEFLADEQASNRDNYAKFLVSYSLTAPIATLTNHFFNSSLLKGRIKMIYKTRDSKWKLSSYFLVLPIIGIATMLTASRTRILDAAEQQPTPLSLPNKMSSNQQIQTADMLSKSRMTKTPGKRINYADSLPAANKSANTKIAAAESSAAHEAPQKTTKVISLRGTGNINLSNYFSREGIPVPGEKLEIGVPRTFAAEPLIFINGVEQELRGTAGFSHIVTDDIKSINVLKGGAAVAAYGDEGRNGVILILTKGN